MVGEKDLILNSDSKELNTVLKVIRRKIKQSLSLRDNIKREDCKTH